MKLKFTVLLFLVALFFSSCGIQPVVPDKVTDVKFSNINFLKGTVTMNMGLQIRNPNNFSITLHGMELAVKVANVSLGIVTVDEKVKILKDTTQVYRVKVNAQLTDLISGIPAILSAISKKETNAEVNGWIKVGVFGLRKKFPVNIKQEKVQTAEEKKQ
jgi:LEA14-like dessication related protein